MIIIKKNKDRRKKYIEEEIRYHKYEVLCSHYALFNNYFIHLLKFCLKFFVMVSHKVEKN